MPDFRAGLKRKKEQSMPKKYFHSVLVTGLGLVVAPGVGGKDLAVLQRKNILENKQTAPPKEKLGQITDFDKEVLIGQRGLRYHTKGTLYLMAAARLALEEAGIVNPEGRETVGVVTGTMTCNAALVADFDKTTLSENPTVVNASIFPETVWNSPPSRAAIRLGLSGINIPVCSGLNSGLDAILIAHEHIRNGDESIVLAGGFEEMTPYFSILFGEQALFPLSEGCAVLVLEQEAVAKDRNSQPLAKIIGGQSCYFPSQVATAQQYVPFRRDLVAETMAENGVTQDQVERIWHLDFCEKSRQDRGLLAKGALEWEGALPILIDLAPHVGISGGLAGALAAVIACSPDRTTLARPSASPQREIIISEDGEGSLAILVVERL